MYKQIHNIINVNIFTVGIELLNSWPLKCAYAVQEIFKTETDYISSLSDIIQVSILNVYLKHMLIRTLFPKLELLYFVYQL